MAQKTITTMDIKEPLLRRAFLRADDINEEDRTVDFSFSSEEPYERFFGVEVLDHKDASVRLDRLRNAGPLLFNHDTSMHIGRVVDAGIRDGKGYAKVKFSKSSIGNEKLQDVKDGILREVSVGYRVHKMQLEKSDEENKRYRVTDWEPMEVSLVSIPADTSVGVGRTANGGHTVTIEKEFQPERKNMSDENKTKALEVNLKEETQKAAQAERSRIADLQKAATQAIERGITVSGDLMTKAISEDWNADRLIKESIFAQPQKAADSGALEKMQREEKRSFSLIKVIRGLMTGAQPDGFEAEVIDETNKRFNGIEGNGGIRVPLEVFSKRSLLAGAYAAGGSTVPLEKGAIIEKLDPVPVVELAGSQVLRGMTGPISFPRQTSGATAEWVAEASEVSKSTPGTDDVTLSPLGLSAYVEFSKQLALTSAIDVESWVREEIIKRIYLAIDKAALVGPGTAGQPKGVFSLDTSTSGINTVAFGGAPTWAKVLEFEGDLEDVDALRGALAFVTSSPVKAKWKATTKDTGSGQFLADGDSANGYPVFVTSQLAGTTYANRVVFANWSDMLVGMFGAVELSVDQSAALQRKGLVGITGLTYADVAIRIPASFSVSTDAGNQ